MKALRVPGFEDLLTHSTRGLRVSPKVLAKVGLRTWVNPGVSHSVGCALIGKVSPNFIKIRITKEEAKGRRGGMKGETDQRTAHQSSCQALQQAADSSRFQRGSEGFWKPDIITGMLNQESGDLSPRSSKTVKYTVVESRL